jgi:DNA-binding MarR family transcriptional regulator
MANKAGKGRKRSETADLHEDAAALFAAMTELLRIYQFRDRDKVGYHGLTITQSYAMEIVIRRGGLTLNDLAAELGLDKSTVSRIVDGLERKRAIRRAPNPDDGRSMLIQATASGEDRRTRIEADIVAENAKVLAAFSPAARRQIVPIIRALSRAAKTRALEPVDEDR